MEPWIIIWLSISQPANHNVMINSHTAINFEMGAQVICKFFKNINELPQV